MKTPIKLYSLYFIIVIAGIFCGQSTANALEFFIDFTPTNSWTDYVGKIHSFDTIPSPGDEIGVYILDTENKLLLVAGSVINASYPEHYILHIFEDDSLTPEKDGAKNGDILIFKYWQKSSGHVFNILESNMKYEPLTGFLSLTIPPVFKSSPMGTACGELVFFIPELSFNFRADFNSDYKLDLIDVLMLMKKLSN